MGKTFWAVLIGVVVILVGAFLLLHEDASAPSQSVEAPLEVTADDHTLGPETASVTLIEFGDFQCPHCGRAAPVLKELRSDFPDELRLVYRHYPISSAHPHARAAARASEAAAQQGDFWAMHDLLFNRQREWSSDPNARKKFMTYAEQLGLDMEQFRSDFEAAGSQVDKDKQIGNQLNVRSTPTFFLNGEEVEDLGSFDELRERINTVLEDRQSNN